MKHLQHAAAPEINTLFSFSLPLRRCSGELSRANRQNQAKQLREAKKAEAALSKRLGSGPSRNVVIVPLSATASAVGVAAALLDLADSAVLPTVPAGFPAPLCLGFKAFRTNLLVSAPPRGGQFAEAPLSGASTAPLRFDVTHTLAGIRGADIIVLVIDVSPEGLAATAAASAAAAASKTVMVPLASRSMAAQAEPSSVAASGGAGAAAADSAGMLGGVGAIAGASAGEGLVDGEGELFLACLKATGVPAVLAVVQGLDAHVTPAKAADARRAVQRLLATEFGEDVVRVVEATDPLRYAPSAASAIGSIPLGPVPLPIAFNSAHIQRTSGAGLHLMRGLCSLPLRAVQWRSHRSCLTAQTLHWEPSSSPSPSPLPAAPAAKEEVVGGSSTDASSEPVGTLSVWGYLKGRPLNVHQLVVMPWGGTYRIADVRSARDAFAKPPATAKPVSGPGADIASVGGMPTLQVAAATAAASGFAKGDTGCSFASITAASLAASIEGAAGRSLYAGSRYVPMTAMLLAVPTLSAKVRSIALPDLDDRAAVVAVGSGSAAIAAAASDANVLAVPKSELCESLEVVAPPEEGEEDEDEDEDDDVAGASGASAAGGAGRKGRSRPAGMSRYQASWLVDEGREDDDDESEDEVDDAGALDADEHVSGKRAVKKGTSAAAEMDASDVESGDDGEEDGDDDDDDADDLADEEGLDVFAEGTMDPNGEFDGIQSQLRSTAYNFAHCLFASPA